MTTVQQATESMTTVTARMMSGAVAFGPQAVPKALTVGELKNFWDTGAPKKIMFGSKLMQDHETLKELPLQAELTVAMMPEPYAAAALLRAEAAAALLEGFDQNAIRRDRDSDPAFTLVYTCCLIALEAVYGRDDKFWREQLEFNIIPTLPNISHSLPQDIAYGPGQIRKFQNGCWPKGKLFPAEALLEALRGLDHLQLTRAVQSNTVLRDELQPLVTFRYLNSTLLGSWLDVSVKPLLLD